MFHATQPGRRRGRQLAAAALFAVLATGVGPALADYYDGATAYERHDYATAWAELLPLAESGDPRAQLLIGRMYKDGQGVLQDYVQAHKWLNLAAAAGQPQAGTLRDEVVRLMTPQQIADAQRAAAEWRPQAAPSWTPPAAASVSTAGSIGYGSMAPAAGGYYLTPGETRELQRALRDRGYYASGIDGIVGPATTAAIRHYQADAGLIVDGQATAELLDHIRYTQPPVRNVTGRVASSGTVATSAPAKQPLDHVTGATPEVSYAFIVAVQEELKKHGFNPGPVDGLHGPRTRRAVERYQARAGLPVDGKITLALLNHLKFTRPPVYASD